MATSDTRQLPGKQHLQITHRRLLEIVAASVAIEAGAPLGSHADVVACFVENGVHRGVEARV